MATGRSGGGGGAAGKCRGGFFGLLFTVGFIVLIYWAIFQPHHIRAAVDSATLSNLTVSSNAASAAGVSYHLVVKLSLYNPSVRVNIYYDALDAELRFRDAAVIGPADNDTSPSEFYQRSKTNEVVTVEFDYGRPGAVAVAGDAAGDLEKEMRSGGPVSLELHVGVQVRYVFRMFKLRQKPRISCPLRIPVRKETRGHGVGGLLVSGERCKVKY